MQYFVPGYACEPTELVPETGERIPDSLDISRALLRYCNPDAELSAPSLPTYAGECVQVHPLADLLGHAEHIRHCIEVIAWPSEENKLGAVYIANPDEESGPGAHLPNLRARLN